MGRYFRQTFGTSVYKVPVSIMGFTCPNIDGTVAKGGCIYCENESFSPNLSQGNSSPKFRLSHTSPNPFLEEQLAQLEAQVADTKSKLVHKFKAKQFLIYFQSFTNTYAPLDTLKALYERALRFEGVVGISIGTRSDAMTEEVLEYLGGLAKKWEIWVEFGVQSCHDETLKRINRGHDFENASVWIEKCKAKGLKVCAHVIFGLPGENQAMMLESVQKTAALGINAIKIHPLYVTKRTALANEYAKGRFVPMEEALYLDTLVKTLHLLPSDVVVQRITAGVDDDTLIAPAWCGNLKQQRKHIRLALEEAGLYY